MKSSKVFITGCDTSTRWMLPWFKENFYKYNPNSELQIYDFDVDFSHTQGWFKKPAAMVHAGKLADHVCWIDSDIEVLGSLDNIWKYVQPNKLTMVEDQPWSTRRGETWHNSGVVAFNRIPSILYEWATAVANLSPLDMDNPMFGDQDVLHGLLPPLRRQIHINTAPKKWNTLRLDILDGTEPEDIKLMHWTGAKGKEVIKEKMKWEE
jgi:hypothetical protein